MSLSIGAGTQRQRVSSHVPETGVATFSIEGWALQWCLPTWHNREAVRDSHRSIFFLWRRRSTRLYHFLCSKHNGHQRYLPRHEQWVHRRSYAGPARVRRPCGRGWGGGGGGGASTCKQLNLTLPIDSFSAMAKNCASESIPT